MGYFGRPDIVGLRSIQPKFAVAMGGTVEPVTLYASASETTWTRDTVAGEHARKFDPWKDLEYRWTLIDASTGQPYATPDEDLLLNPVPHLNGMPSRVDPAVHQIGPEFCMVIRRPGTYRIRMDVQGMDEHGRIIRASTESFVRPSRWMFACSTPNTSSLNEANTTGTITMTCTIGAGPRAGTYSHTFDIYSRDNDVKGWLESICGAGNVEYSGGTMFGYHGLAQVQDMPGNPPHPWPLCPNGSGCHQIGFVRELGSVPVTLAVENNISVGVAGNHLGFFVQRQPHCDGSSGSTVTVEAFAGTKVYYDTNYDGSKGASDGSILRPYKWVDGTGQLPINQGASDTMYLVKRGSRLGTTLPGGQSANLIAPNYRANLNCVRWTTYGDPSLPKPVLFLYGGRFESNLIEHVLRKGYSHVDLVIDGFVIETWNPDSSLCTVPRSEGPGRFYRRFLGDCDGTQFPSWGWGFVLSNCTFRWNTEEITAELRAWSMNKDDAFTSFDVMWNCDFRMARGRSIFQGGGGIFEVQMGNRYYGGGYRTTPLDHQFYNVTGNHYLRRLELQEHIGIDGNGYLGSAAQKCNIYNSAEGISTNYLYFGDLSIRGFGSTAVTGGATNLNTSERSIGNVGLSLYERIHHHRTGLCIPGDVVTCYLPLEWTRWHTVRDCWYTRIGLTPDGGRAELYTQTPIPGNSYLCMYRNRVHAAPNSRADGKGPYLFAAGAGATDGAYIAHNVFIKETNQDVGLYALNEASMPHLEMHDNLYLCNHPGGLVARGGERNFYTLAQMQALGQEARSVVTTVSSYPVIDLGTDERMGNMWPQGKQRRGQLRLGGNVIRLGR